MNGGHILLFLLLLAAVLWAVAERVTAADARAELRQARTRERARLQDEIDRHRHIRWGNVRHLPPDGDDRRTPPEPSQ